jgi:hypothetical protein
VSGIRSPRAVEARAMTASREQIVAALARPAALEA